MTPSFETIPVGYCQCGCGGKTSLAQRTVAKFGHIKGQPVRYICGHHRVHQRVDFRDAPPFKIDGIYCKLIQLTRGLYAIVDAADHVKLSRHRWCAIWSEGTKSFYAVRNRARNGGPRIQVSMHREILGLDRGHSELGDHIESGRTLDNRSKNLRRASDSGNAMNERISSVNTTGFKGVSRCSNSNTFRAQIMVNGAQIYLGTRKTPQAAHEELYVPAAILYHREFANDGKNWYGNRVEGLPEDDRETNLAPRCS
jgi:hypothetical protein